MSWLCLEVADGAVIRGAFSLVLDVWQHYLKDYTVTNKFRTTEFSASSARFGVRMCLPIFWTRFTWLIVWLCQETCVQMLSSFMSVGKFVADRFQPSLSRLSRRATLPLCRQRSGLFNRDHWKDRIMCRSWSLFKCRWKHLWNDIGMFA